MREFEANDCRLCKRTFCCPECRLKHEIKIHKIFPGCNLCIYGLSAREDMFKETHLEHLEKTHLPLNCVYCRRIFTSVTEILQHRKCPVLQKKNDLINTTFKEATPGEVDEEAQDSPILQELQRNELLSYQFDLATSTPMPRVQEPAIFDKDKLSDIQFDREKSSQMINKSIIKKTDSRVDSPKRRVTFVETPGNVEKIDSQDKTGNKPENSEEKTSSLPATPATGISNDQFYSAKSDWTDFLPGKVTDGLVFTPATGIGIDGAKSDLNKVSSTPGFFRRRGLLSKRFAPVEMPQVPSNAQENMNALSDSVSVCETFDAATSKDENLNITDPNQVSMELDSSWVPGNNEPIALCSPLSVSNPTKSETSPSKISDQSKKGEKATGIGIDQYGAKSKLNKVSSTPGFFRRRGLLSERFVPVEMPQVPSNAQENMNALSDSVSVCETFDAATSKDENLNITDPNQVSMELNSSWVPGNNEPIALCSPLSISKPTNLETSPSQISNQSKKGDTNLTGNASASIVENSTKANEEDESSQADQHHTSSGKILSPVTPATGMEIEQFYSAKSQHHNVSSTPGLFLRLSRTRGPLSGRFAPVELDVCSWVPANTDEPIASCTPVSASHLTKPPTKISDQSEKGDTNVPIPIPDAEIKIKEEILEEVCSQNGYKPGVDDPEKHLAEQHVDVLKIKTEIKDEDGSLKEAVLGLADTEKQEEVLEKVHSQNEYQPGGEELEQHSAGLKNNEEESSKADQRNPLADVTNQMNENEDNNEPTHDTQLENISFKTSRLRSAGIFDDQNTTDNKENDENKPPNTKVIGQEKNEIVNAKLSKPEKNDKTYCHNSEKTKISNPTDSPAESSQPRATIISMPTPVLKKPGFNLPNHLASTPIIHQYAKIQQVNMVVNLSKIPEPLSSSESDTSAETNQRKEFAIYDSQPENNESFQAFVTVSSMTEPSLWTSMTQIVKSVFRGLNRSRNEERVSFKRRLSNTDLDSSYSSTPRVKRYKFSDIKCRRPIRDPLALPYSQSSEGATLQIVRTVYEAGPSCKIMWDKATQTDDYLMDGWHPQPK